ncbi:alpha-crystallin A chain-like [Ornithodoros turicata]
MAFPRTRSLVPSSWFGGRDWWDSWDVPSRLLDQHFGSELRDEDLLPSQLYRGVSLRPFRRQLSRNTGVSEVKNEEEAFQVKLDVSHFAPEEITVKTVNNSITVTAKHEEKMDEHGFVSREFTRRYVLPEGVSPEAVTSSLSPDGVLTVTAPKQPPLAANERVVPIAIQGGVTTALPVKHE